LSEEDQTEDDGMRMDAVGTVNRSMSLGLYTLQLLAELDEVSEPQLADICNNAEERR
jgi:hypothetical protein